MSRSGIDWESNCDPYRIIPTYNPKAWFKLDQAFSFGAPGMACSAFNSAVSITVVVVG